MLLWWGTDGWVYTFLKIYLQNANHLNANEGFYYFIYSASFSVALRLWDASSQPPHTHTHTNWPWYPTKVTVIFGNKKRALVWNCRSARLWFSHVALSGIIRGACSANKTNKRQLEISAWGLLRKEEILKTEDEENNTASSELSESLILDQLAISIAVSVQGVAGVWRVRVCILGCQQWAWVQMSIFSTTQHMQSLAFHLWAQTQTCTTNCLPRSHY